MVEVDASLRRLVAQGSGRASPSGVAERIIDTVKRLYLLRHAKSDWGGAAESDHERPLAERGRSAAGLVGRFLAELGQVPDRVVSSSAVRAATTAQLACEAGGWDLEVEIRTELYDASPAVLLALIQDQSEEVESLMLVGHEPVWSETAGVLLGGARVKMVTAALARIDFAASRWRDVEAGIGLLAWLVTPKLLAAELERE
jgi:phosphohistidine phosphatase